MHRLHILDLKYLDQPEAIAAYVIETPVGLIMFETGPGSTTDRLTAELANIGFSPSDIQHLFVTHIHLDHAGAAGWLAQHGCSVHVHEFGARHLIDPTKLLASARRIYQDKMDTIWGEFLAVPESQVVSVCDGDVFEFGGLSIRAIETPGHARHHHAFATELDGKKICFTGDATGTFIHESPRFMSLPTPPPEFELNVWLSSLGQLDAEHFAAIYPTHFGRVNDVADHLKRVATALQEHVMIIRKSQKDAANDRNTIESDYGKWFHATADQHDVPDAKRPFYVSDALVRMNVTGILRWLG